MREFLKRWIPGLCEHSHIRCIHGDEIIVLGGRRKVCLDCGRSLKGPLPYVCSITGQWYRRPSDD